MRRVNPLAVLLLAIGLGSLLVGLAYSGYVSSSYPYSNYGGQWWTQQGMMGQWTQQTQTYTGSQLTLDQAKAIAQQYLASSQNPNLAIKEIMEFHYNFYIIYYEKDTGIGAFEMLIWKQIPSQGMMGGMMGGMGRIMVGVIMPEPGPNMMWNTKYSSMGPGMMGQGMMTSRYQASTVMTISKDRALQLAQAYLDANFNGAKVEGATQFYGYYTIDFEANEKIVGMLSVNGETGQIWYHSWHGAFIQEIELE